VCLRFSHIGRSGVLSMAVPARLLLRVRFSPDTSQPVGRLVRGPSVHCILTLKCSCQTHSASLCLCLVVVGFFVGSCLVTTIAACPILSCCLLLPHPLCCLGFVTHTISNAARCVQCAQAHRRQACQSAGGKTPDTNRAAWSPARL